MGAFSPKVMYLVAWVVYVHLQLTGCTPARH
jgi:hypothetical protein